MVSVIRSDPYGAEGIRQAGTFLGNALMQRGAENRKLSIEKQKKAQQAQQLGILGEVMGDIDQSLPIEQQIGMLTKTLGERGVSPDIVKPYLNSILQGGIQTRNLQAKQGQENRLQGIDQDVLAKEIAGEEIPQELLRTASPQTGRAILSRRASQENLSNRIAHEKETEKTHSAAANEMYQTFIKPSLQEKYPDKEFPDELPPGLKTTEIKEVFDLADPTYGRKFEEAAGKANQEYVTSLRNAAEGAKTQNMQLKRMARLSESGTSSTVATVALSKYLEEQYGIPAEILQNPTNEQIEKTAMDLTSGISKVFPGKILQSEFESYLKKLPRLLQTVAGRAAVIRNLLLTNEGIEARYSAYKQITKGKRVPPIDIQDQVEEMVASKIEDIGNRFVEGLGQVGEPAEGSVRRYSNGVAYDIPPEYIDRFNAEVASR